MAVVLIVAASAMSALGVLTVFASASMVPRTLFPDQFKAEKQTMLAARKEAVDRSSHFETLLVALGSFELGILAYVGTVFLQARIGELDDLTVSRPVFFGLTTALFFVTTVAYLHSWKVYMAYGTYCVQLEIAALSRGLRTTSRVFDLAQNPLVPRALKPVVAAASSIQVVSLFPVFILSAAVIGFGTRLDMPRGVTRALAILVFSWSVVYVAPSFIEFSKLVNLACEKDSPRA